MVPYLQRRPIHAVLFVERLDEYRVDSVDHQVGLMTAWEVGARTHMSAQPCRAGCGPPGLLRASDIPSCLVVLPARQRWASKAVLEARGGMSLQATMLVCCQVC